ncbi:MAG: hypothetical protein VKI82_06270 [Leptolyngbya sp.]|nr:hypothetical protein [Leptolyngbya sp.]
MAQLILNNLDPKILSDLQLRAAKHHRSPEDELKAILQEVLSKELAEKVERMAAFRAQATQIRQSLVGNTQTDSAILIREDRDQ